MKVLIVAAGLASIHNDREQVVALQYRAILLKELPLRAQNMNPDSVSGTEAILYQFLKIS